jgi:hypothetical protein
VPSLYISSIFFGGGLYNSYYNLYFSSYNLLGGGNPKISKDGPNKIEKRKEKRSGIPKEKGQQKKKLKKEKKSRKHKTSLARKSKRKRPNRRDKNKEKKRKEKKKTEAPGDTPVLATKKMSATGAEARAAVKKVNVNNRSGSLGSRLERKYISNWGLEKKNGQPVRKLI